MASGLTLSARVSYILRSHVVRAPNGFFTFRGTFSDKVVFKAVLGSLDVSLKDRIG